ncbi:conserved hypothetical protein [Leishmania major strain Friedlin]|uniref:Uncharacterized protein n=1 Tax=Leishmania major TaxID=5664 RepID=Q4Q6V6_LEIMA|nr:conserved hypothetical protein [Leishmania major strain Friedlin]CAG9578574.1 hypothetical_protein_-_conserved [Leishmania major strain Friedlin]CAJ06793.1 conserved hypothetical protein [Leishmania major strain Friedlin]|eukprot:XP_001684942.1 conserved hypothetical protein [Leishmania major strain Friedlin]
MQRLVLSRRNLDGCGNTLAIVVTEVYVGGTGAQPKAEVFAQDCVTQVVFVKEEVIYMRLKGMSAFAAPSRLTSPPPPPPQTNGSSATCGAIAACSDRTSQPTATATASSLLKGSATSKNEAELATEVKRSAPKTSEPPAATAKSAATDATTQQAISDGADTAAAPTTAEPLAPKAEALRRRRGWGPEAYELFPENYMSTPGKRPRMVRSEKKTTSAQAAKCSKTESSNAAVASTKAGGGEESSDKQAPADKHLGWGPEASKLFADNYVSSPEKLARRKRSQRRVMDESAESAAPAGAAALPKSALKAPVSRALQYPTADTEEGRTTVGHAVDNAIVVDETSPAVELPKGWGRESLKFFDPNTYCDDPAKARLLPNMDYSRSRRHRRPATL